MGVYEEITIESKVVKKKKAGDKKMKKLMVAVLVLVGVFAYAQSEIDAQSYLDAAAPFDSGTHMFTIQQNGTLHIQLYQSVNELGHVDVFGYYKILADNTMEDNPLAYHNPSEGQRKLKANAEFDIEGLQANEKVVFYVIAKKDGEDEKHTDFDINPNTPGGSAGGATIYTVGFKDKNKDAEFSFKRVGFTSDSAPAASGQPLPGALTTMLVAGGCAAFLRKRKAARK